MSKDPDGLVIPKIRGVSTYWLIATDQRQGGGCAICQRPINISGGANAAHVDHCHATGRRRGLLCRECNLGLGHFRDNIASLYAAIDYLNAEPLTDDEAMYLHLRSNSAEWHPKSSGWKDLAILERRILADLGRLPK